MNELKAPKVGYRILKCGFDDCNFQLVDEADSKMFSHIEEEHGDSLRRAWKLGRVE